MNYFLQDKSIFELLRYRNRVFAISVMDKSKLAPVFLLYFIVEKFIRECLNICRCKIHKLDSVLATAYQLSTTLWYVSSYHFFGIPFIIKSFGILSRAAERGGQFAPGPRGREAS